MNTRLRLLTTCLFALGAIVGTARAEGGAGEPVADEVEAYLENSSGASADATTFRVFWKDGIRMESGDGHFKAAIGGRLMFDINSSSANDGIDTASNPDLNQQSLGFRRARLYMAGTVHKKIGFKVQFDFASGDLGLRDVYLSLKNLGSGDLVFGHMKQPFSLGEMTSSRYTTFSERATSTQAFAPSYDGGIAWFGTLLDDKMLLHAGTFMKTGSNGASSGNGGLGITVRWGMTVLENRDEGMFLFVGVGFTRQDLGASNSGRNSTQYRARPDSFGTRYIDTGVLIAQSDTRFNLEAAFRMGAIHAQAEIYFVEVDRQNAANPSFTGFYAQIGWFITGEHRAFSSKKGGWTRLRPKELFWSGDDGGGAWEVALRFDSTDLSDSGVNGGEMTSFTIGFNWYWNPNTRMMFDYVLARIEDSPVNVAGRTGRINTLIIRWQIDF